jgi:hypothetical protein
MQSDAQAEFVVASEEEFKAANPGIEKVVTGLRDFLHLYASVCATGDRAIETSDLIKIYFTLKGILDHNHSNCQLGMTRTTGERLLTPESRAEQIRMVNRSRGGAAPRLAVADASQKLIVSHQVLSIHYILRPLLAEYLKPLVPREDTEDLEFFSAISELHANFLHLANCLRVIFLPVWSSTSTSSQEFAYLHLCPAPTGAVQPVSLAPVERSHSVCMHIFFESVLSPRKERLLAVTRTLLNATRSGTSVSPSLLSAAGLLFQTLRERYPHHYETLVRTPLLQCSQEFVLSATSDFCAMRVPEYIDWLSHTASVESEQISRVLVGDGDAHDQALRALYRALLTSPARAAYVFHEGQGCFRDAVLRRDVATATPIFSAVLAAQKYDPANQDICCIAAEAAFTSLQSAVAELLTKIPAPAAPSLRDEAPAEARKQYNARLKAVALHGLDLLDLEAWAEKDLVVTACRSSSIVARRVHEAFSGLEAVGPAHSDLSRLLAQTTDSYLSGQGPADLRGDQSRLQFERRFEALARLVDRVKERDVFFRTYDRLLALRLLALDRADAAVLDAEAAAVQKLKASVGWDQMLGRAVQDRLRGAAAVFEGAVTSGPVTLRVLDSGQWAPVAETERNRHQVALAVLPEAIADHVRTAQISYAERQAGRGHSEASRVIVQPSTVFGTATLSLGPTLVRSASTLQMCILQLFKPSTPLLTYQDIVSALCLHDDRDSLDAHLLGLVLPSKTGPPPLLQKDPKSEALLPADRFRVNPGYLKRAEKGDAKPMVIQLRVFKLPNRAADKAAALEIDEHRSYVYQAAIVRFMKANNALSQRELVRLVVDDLQRLFTPDVEKIKLTIETLIDTMYIERDTADPEKFTYVA